MVTAHFSEAVLHNTAHQSIYTPPGGQVEWLVGVGVGHQEPVLAAPPRLLVVAVVAVHPQPVQDPPLAAVHLQVAIFILFGEGPYHFIFFVCFHT